MWHRKPVVAGAFYPGDRESLEGMLKKYFSQVKIPANIEHQLEQDALLGVISPHAGYIYSGPVAAYSYSLLYHQDYEVVIVLAPSHQARFNGASIIPSGTYATPLGEVPIDSLLGEAVEQEAHFQFIEQVHAVEHSLEVQVPFLQYALKTFSLVPIIVGTVDLQVCEEIAQELYRHLQHEKRKFVIVISTDLSHYYPYEKACELDATFSESLHECNASLLAKVLQSGKAEACGAAPLMTGLSLARLLGGKRIETLHYANSGDTSGDKSRVVGYLAAAIMRQ